MLPLGPAGRTSAASAPLEGEDLMGEGEGDEDGGAVVEEELVRWAEAGPEERRRVRWAGTKPVERAMEKLRRAYDGDARRLLDVCRQVGPDGFGGAGRGGAGPLGIRCRCCREKKV